MIDIRLKAVCLDCPNIHYVEHDWSEYQPQPHKSHMITCGHIEVCRHVGDGETVSELVKNAAILPLKRAGC